MAAVSCSQSLLEPSGSSGVSRPSQSGILLPGSPYPVWSLVWSDEFNGTSFDTNKWAYENGDGCDQGICGWGNNELEYYQSQNISLQSGNLVIAAKKESRGGKAYTSGRIKTEGKFAIRYGRIEARMKIPASQGLWPAFWMLGANIRTVSWPACGEIDIMEHVNTENVVWGSAHWKQNGVHQAATAPGSIPVQTDWHVFAVEWSDHQIKWLVDGAVYQTLDSSGTDMEEFQKPFYLLLNLAVGGNWPGASIDESKLPAQMLVDYVRVYECAPDVSIDFSKFILQNDLSGKGSIANYEAGIWMDYYSNYSSARLGWYWNWPSSGTTSKSFQNIFCGQRGSVTSSGSGFPFQIGRSQAIWSDWGFQFIAGTPTGQFHCAYNIDIYNSDADLDAGNPASEIQVWTYKQNSPAGTPKIATIQVHGLSWDLYSFSQTVNGRTIPTYAYQCQQNQSDLWLNLRDFIADAKSRNYVSDNQWVGSVDAGSEVVEGEGHLKTYKYKCDLQRFPNLLGNGGFESGFTSWSLGGDNGMSALSASAVFSGAQGVRVTDGSGTLGSSLYSASLPATAGKTYALSFQARLASGAAWQMAGYLNFYDASGTLLNPSQEMAKVGSTSWNLSQVSGVAPAGTATMKVWFHSFTTQISTCDIDEVELIAP